MKSFDEILENTRTIHAFEPNSVSEDVIKKALSDSLKAPNHKFTFPWKYVLAGTNQKNKLADLLVELKTDGAEEDDKKIKAIREKILNPELVAFCQKLADDPFQEKEDYATLSCSVQLAALSLSEQGVGYKWSTGKITRHARAYEILEIDPNLFKIVGFIHIGKAKVSARRRNRPTLDEVLTLGD